MDSSESKDKTPENVHRGRISAAIAAVARPPPPVPTPAPPVPKKKGSILVEIPLSDGTIAVETISDEVSKLHALIIGINDYPKLPKLKGAVADADEISNFLTSESELKVPSSQITNLRDKTATRQRIIESFQALKENTSINRGDPILIYYAGHGGSIKATDKWKDFKGAHMVQVIFPYDYDTKPEDSSDPIEPIPDRTIAGLLNELSAAKGDNITVIFDSCHSASVTRLPKKGVLDRRVRSAQVKRDIPWNIDEDIVDPELGIAPPKKDEKRYTNLPLCVNQTSHVLLAACGSEEKAHEEDGRGVFTVALLKSIRANGVDKITYHNLIRSLPILSSQSPHCYGKHKGRILFDSSVPSPRATMIPVKLDSENKTIVLQAGAASGVTTESIWEIYDSVTGEVLLGTFRAEPPHVSTAVLKSEDKGQDNSYQTIMDRPSSTRSGVQAYARQVRVGVINELRVYFTPAAKERIFATEGTERAISYSVGSGEHEVGYVVHPSEDSADIAVDLVSEQEVSFRLCDRQAEQCGVATLKKRVRAERSAVEEVLFGAAKWQWHLQRKNTDSEEITDLVTMELITLGTRVGMRRIMCPPDERKVVNRDGIADFEVRRKDLYGIKLTSRVEKPIYIRMFYFDTTDFSIADMFGHAVGRDRVMGTKDTFIIGDNAEGGTSLQFTLNKDEKLDLGYMKIFWSTQPLELEGLGQKPIFNRASRKWSRLRGARRDINDDTIEWGTALLAMVQRSPDAAE